MKDIYSTEVICLHIKGIFYLKNKPSENFNNVIKRGLRLIAWKDSVFPPTSLSFIFDISLSVGEKKESQIVLLTPLETSKNIKPSDNFTIGYPNIELGEFIITEIIGEWEEKVP
jgi:hypothetical protein